MGMFDYYRPRPEIGCPVCGASSLEWQGFAGPCALLVWEQGQSAPVDQIVAEESKLPSARLKEWKLSVPRFEIRAECRCCTPLMAVGLTENGVWMRTDLLNSENAVAYPHENEHEFRRRLKMLGMHPGHFEHAPGVH
jgi:hypothetical protein